MCALELSKDNMHVILTQLQSTCTCTPSSLIVAMTPKIVAYWQNICTNIHFLCLYMFCIHAFFRLVSFVM